MVLISVSTFDRVHNNINQISSLNYHVHMTSILTLDAPLHWSLARLPCSCHHVARRESEKTVRRCWVFFNTLEGSDIAHNPRISPHLACSLCTSAACTNANTDRRLLAIYSTHPPSIHLLGMVCMVQPLRKLASSFVSPIRVGSLKDYVQSASDRLLGMVSRLTHMLRFQTFIPSSAITYP